MRAASLLILVLTAGCSHVQVNGGSLYITAPALVAVAGVAVLAANVDARSDGMVPTSDRATPQMLADRAVAEQDCTQPIEDWSANLKCR